MIKDYSEIYALFDGLTPLKADCGTVCGKSCCGGSSNRGMLLFPGEKTSLTVTEHNGLRLAVCDGDCRRDERPLSCRIFPFFPVKLSDGVRVIPDWRGYDICPLIRFRKDIIFVGDFINAVKKAGELLYSDPDCSSFLSGITEDIETEKKLLSLTEDL